MELPGLSTHIFTGSTVDPRGLRRVDEFGRPSAGRMLGAWFRPDGTSLQVKLDEGKSCLTSIYFADWDGCGRALPPRSQRVDVIEPTFEQILDSVLVPSISADFCDDDYVTWSIKGRVEFRITSLNQNRPIANAVFFDPETGPGVKLTLQRVNPAEGFPTTGFLEWVAIPGRVYRLQRSRSLDPVEWVVAGPPVIASDRAASAVIPRTNPREAEFFRVILPP
ncbi:MAG: hypothetical protein FJ405_11365 [Verrucomicrobia bacterium]|nr:hypothetical protein [Verrucomicrobiota bacterium]